MIVRINTRKLVAVERIGRTPSTERYITVSYHCSIRCSASGIYLGGEKGKEVALHEVWSHTRVIEVVVHAKKCNYLSNQHKSINITLIGVLSQWNIFNQLILKTHMLKVNALDLSL